MLPATVNIALIFKSAILSMIRVSGKVYTLFYYSPPHPLDMTSQDMTNLPILRLVA